MIVFSTSAQGASGSVMSCFLLSAAMSCYYGAFVVVSAANRILITILSSTFASTRRCLSPNVDLVGWRFEDTCSRLVIW